MSFDFCEHCAYCRVSSGNLNLFHYFHAGDVNHHHEHFHQFHQLDTVNNEIPTSNFDESNWFTATGKGTLFFSSGKKIIDSSYYFTTHFGNIARDTRISKLISLIMLGHSSKKSIEFEILEELE